MYLTISLNGIVGDTAEHSKFGKLSNAELMAHPREKVSQTIMSTLNSLGYSCAPACEG